jgi:hypothetical protein
MASPLTTVDSVISQRAGHTLASFLPAIIGSAIPITNTDVTADKMGISIKVSIPSPLIKSQIRTSPKCGNNNNTILK